MSDNTPFNFWHERKGMTNKWLASQGLISVRDLWIKAQGYS